MTESQADEVIGELRGIRKALEDLVRAVEALRRLSIVDSKTRFVRVEEEEVE